ncbi:guanine deaminase [Microdochium nivale]|nr:guanine deaminase [Microdochium nivale]
MHLVFHGTLIHSASLAKLDIIENGLVVVDTGSGTIVSLTRDVPREQVRSRLVAAAIPGLDIDDAQAYEIHHLDPASQFLMPGLVDTHNHAPQWAQRGLGQGMHILDWLSSVTFPNEARFADTGHARRIYTAAVEGLLRQGITTASYYGSAHAPATKILADICLARGQRALVGKCNMNREAPEYYRDESAAASLRDTEDCIAHIRNIDPRSQLLGYVLTPRFAITCDDELLRGLGDIARREEEAAGRREEG